MDIFKKRSESLGPIGEQASGHDGYFVYPCLEGSIGSRMKFRGREMIIWNLNNYLGLADHPEVRKADADAAAEYGLGHPMGARMMSGENEEIVKLEKELASLEQKDAAFLLNYGYQGLVSILDAVTDRHDIILYDAESHACIVDGVRLHQGKRYVFKHNDVADLDRKLKFATKQVDASKGGILVVTEGVFGMAGDQGKLSEIVTLKSRYNFRLLVDDAHGFGVFGENGAGTCSHQNVLDETDLYFSTFAKSMACIGAFIAGNKDIIRYLRYNMRSQIFAKTLPTPIVAGLSKRLEILKKQPALRKTLWENVNQLQSGLKKLGFNTGNTNSPVTPVFLKGNIDEAKNLITDLRENFQIFCSVVIYPVVPKDTIMLRMIPTAAHSRQDIEDTLYAFDKVSKKLRKGIYQSSGKNYLEQAKYD